MADDSFKLQTTLDNWESSYSKISTYTEALYKTLGISQTFNIYSAIYGLDNCRRMIFMPDTEHQGYTFITRPRLNLLPTVLRADRILSLLDNDEADSIQMALKIMLDTNLQKQKSISIPAELSKYGITSNPFISVLSNRLVSLSGWPDPVLDIETSDGGFFSESMTYPKGHDQLTRNYDLMMSFSDIQGGFIMMLFLIWVRWLTLVVRGVVTPYLSDIEERRMGFTSSVYRFVMDPSNKYITKWAKATGCFPRSTPIGNFFNFDANSSAIEASHNISIPFTVAGKIEYMDPIILKEFNMLIDNFTKGLDKKTAATNDEKLSNNCELMPYIDLTKNHLKWVKIK